MSVPEDSSTADLLPFKQVLREPQPGAGATIRMKDGSLRLLLRVRPLTIETSPTEITETGYQFRQMIDSLDFALQVVSRPRSPNEPREVFIVIASELDPAEEVAHLREAELRLRAAAVESLLRATGLGVERLGSDTSSRLLHSLYHPHQRELPAYAPSETMFPVEDSDERTSSDLTALAAPEHLSHQEEHIVLNSSEALRYVRTLRVHTLPPWVTDGWLQWLFEVDYADVSLLIQPLPLAHALDALNERAAALQAKIDVATDAGMISNSRQIDAVKDLRDLAAAIADGTTRPYHLTVLVTVHAQSLPELDERTLQLEALMEGSTTRRNRYTELDVFTAALPLLAGALPELTPAADRPLAPKLFDGRPASSNTAVAHTVHSQVLATLCPWVSWQAPAAEADIKTVALPAAEDAATSVVEPHRVKIPDVVEARPRCRGTLPSLLAASALALLIGARWRARHSR